MRSSRNANAKNPTMITDVGGAEGAAAALFNVSMICAPPRVDVGKGCFITTYLLHYRR